MCQRLAEAGISAVVQRSIGGPQWGASGSQYVYVEGEHLDRAREILSVPEGISGEELTKLSEQAAPTQLTQPAKGKPIEIPVPKRSAWERVSGRATHPRPVSDEPDDHGHGSEDHERPRADA
jgi:hypothetical protein